MGSTLVYQLAVNGAPKEAQEALNRVLRALGMPTCLEELGLKETPEEADRIFAFLAERMPVETPKNSSACVGRAMFCSTACGTAPGNCKRKEEKPMKLEFEYGQGLLGAELPDSTDIFIPGRR